MLYFAELCSFYLYFALCWSTLLYGLLCSMLLLLFFALFCYTLLYLRVYVGVYLRVYRRSSEGVRKPTLLINFAGTHDRSSAMVRHYTMLGSAYQMDARAGACARAVGISWRKVLQMARGSSFGGWARPGKLRSSPSCGRNVVSLASYFCPQTCSEPVGTYNFPGRVPGWGPVDPGYMSNATPH